MTRKGTEAILKSLREVIEFPENLSKSLQVEYKEIFDAIAELTLGDEEKYNGIMTHLNHRIESIPKKTTAIKTAGVTVKQDTEWQALKVAL